MEIRDKKERDQKGKEVRRWVEMRREGKRKKIIRKEKGCEKEGKR